MDRISECVAEFLSGDYDRRQMIAAMRGLDMTEAEMDQVLREVESARASYAEFQRGQAAGLWGAS